jgi:hypothetical protein
MAGIRNMPSQKAKRAKGVQTTEQQPKILQITQDIVQMAPTQDIVQIPTTQDIVQIPATQMAAQMVEIQPYDSDKQIVDDVRHVAQGFPLIQM